MPWIKLTLDGRHMYSPKEAVILFGDGGIVGFDGNIGEYVTLRGSGPYAGSTVRESVVQIEKLLNNANIA